MVNDKNIVATNVDKNGFVKVSNLQLIWPFDILSDQLMVTKLMLAENEWLNKVARITLGYPAHCIGVYYPLLYYIKQATLVFGQVYETF